MNKFLRFDRYLSLGVMLAISVISACSKTGSFVGSQNNEIKEIVIFQGGYVNWAWGYTNWGWFIDRYGNVKAYNVKDHHDWWGVNDMQHIKREDLEHNYRQAHKTLFKIPKAELLEKYALAKSAAEGPFSERADTGRDMGGNGFYFYIWIDEQQIYRQVLLTVSGDITQENMNPAAKKLIEWLAVIHSRYLQDRGLRQ